MKDPPLIQRARDLVDGWDAIKNPDPASHPGFDRNRADKDSWVQRVENLVAVLGSVAHAYQATVDGYRNWDHWLRQGVRQGERLPNLLAHGHTEDDLAIDIRFDGYGSLARALLADLDAGMLTRAEDLISAEVFEGLVTEAEHLLKSGHLICAAALGRVALEDALRQLAKNHLPPQYDLSKASEINTQLRMTAGVYNLSRARHVQGWLDTGNNALHPQLPDPDDAEVRKMLADVREFIAGTL